tara:strand:- start:7206 stop:7652 length:447 start_codon:yes stop_codon:yes gene_type:complete
MLFVKPETHHLTIGQLARESGAGVETLRFYERQKLLPEPPRDAQSGYRRYPASAADRVRFILRAKELGFTLSDIRELLELRARASNPCERVRAIAAGKMREIEAKIRSLRSIQRALKKLSESCAESADEECPILAHLDQAELKPNPQD